MGGRKINCQELCSQSPGESTAYYHDWYSGEDGRYALQEVHSQESQRNSLNFEAKSLLVSERQYMCKLKNFTL